MYYDVEVRTAAKRITDEWRCETWFKLDFYDLKPTVGCKHYIS